jgi:hypothetical protein
MNTSWPVNAKSPVTSYPSNSGIFGSFPDRGFTNYFPKGEPGRSLHNILPRVGPAKLGAARGVGAVVDVGVLYTAEPFLNLKPLGREASPHFFRPFGRLRERVRQGAEMANAIVEDRPQRCAGRFALHALAVMLGIIESAESGEPVKIGVPGTTLPALRGCLKSWRLS